MKKVKVVARNLIINVNAKEVFSDEILRDFFDSYFEEIIHVENECEYEKLVEQYEKQYPRLEGWDFEITEL